MKIPKSFTRAGQTQEVMVSLVKSDAQAVDMEKNSDFVNSLDFKTWLPFAAKTYHISGNIEDYCVRPMPLMPSDLPNRNGIGFPLAELVKYQPPPISRQVFKAWTGTPVHYEHENEDCTTALGVVFDTALTRITGFGGGKFWKVMGLVGVDKNKYPDIANRMLNNQLVTGSMGALADDFTCSVCGAKAHEHQHMNCSHITSTKHVNWRMVDDHGRKQLAYLNAHSLSPIEFSLVESPAWVPALSEELLLW